MSIMCDWKDCMVAFDDGVPYYLILPPFGPEYRCVTPEEPRSEHYRLCFEHGGLASTPGYPISLRRDACAIS